MLQLALWFVTGRDIRREMVMCAVVSVWFVTGWSGGREMLMSAAVSFMFFLQGGA